MTHPDTLCPKHSPATGVKPWRTELPACKACDKLQALADLRALLPPGSTVYTILRSVSRSGMSRVICPVVIRQDGTPLNLTHSVSKALGRKAVYNFADGVKCDGGGMDMGFDLVNSLSYALHGMTEGPLTAKHYANSQGDPQVESFRPGYTLTHRWL